MEDMGCEAIKRTLRFKRVWFHVVAILQGWISWTQRALI